jgi:hypothetical protein
MLSLHDVHEVNKYRAGRFCLSVCVYAWLNYELLNGFVWYFLWKLCHWSFLKILFFDFVQSIIKQCGTNLWVRIDISRATQWQIVTEFLKIQNPARVIFCEIWNDNTAAARTKNLNRIWSPHPTRNSSVLYHRATTPHLVRRLCCFVLLKTDFKNTWFVY